MSSAKIKRPKYYVDFNSQYNSEWAKFFPAISEMYTAYMVDDTARGPTGQFNKEDLNFFNPDNRLMHLPWGLYSAGQAAKNDKFAAQQDMVTGRDRSWNNMVIGDSGGFQIETGTIKWEGKKTTERMLRWLEANCRWSMILDFPTGSLDRRGHDTFYEEFMYDENDKQLFEEIIVNGKKKKQPKILKHPLDFWFCLDRTRENNDYFIQNRIPGKTKFLNVLQGRYHDFSLDEQEILDLDFANLARDEQRRLLATHKISEVDAWYYLTKQYSTDFGDRSFEGWALAGNHKHNFDLTLRRIVIMLYDGLLSDKPWIHFLGMGQAAHSCIYTLIQKGIRDHKMGDKNLTISHDASSAFSSAGAYALVYHNRKLDNTGWSLQFDQLPDGNHLIGSSNPWITKNHGTDLRDTGSPIAQFMTMGDLCVNKSADPNPQKQRTFDKASYAYLMHHNTYVLQQAIIDAQKIFEQPEERSKDLIPLNVLRVKHVVQEVFAQETKEKMLEVIRKNTNTLRLMADTDADISMFESPELFEVDRKRWVKPSGKAKKDVNDNITDCLDDDSLFEM